MHQLKIIKNEGQRRHYYLLKALLRIFPNCFKLAKVTPLFKGGEKHDPNCYRPISLLPCIGKVLERIISKGLTFFFDKNKLFSDCQFGFRKSYNTELAVIDIYEKLLKNLDERLSSCAIFWI